MPFRNSFEKGVYFSQSISDERFKEVYQHVLTSRQQPPWPRPAQAQVDQPTLPASHSTMASLSKRGALEAPDWIPYKGLLVELHKRQEFLGRDGTPESTSRFFLWLVGDRFERVLWWYVRDQLYVLLRRMARSGKGYFSALGKDVVPLPATLSSSRYEIVQELEALRRRLAVSEEMQAWTSFFLL